MEKHDVAAWSHRYIIKILLRNEPVETKKTNVYLDET